MEQIILVLDDWGGWLALLLVVNMAITVLIFIYEQFFLPKPATWQDVHRIVFDAKFDLREQIEKIDDVNAIRNIVLSSELRLRDQIKELKNGKNIR